MRQHVVSTARRLDAFGPRPLGLGVCCCCFQLPLLHPHVATFTVLELSDIFWRFSVLSLSLQRAAAAAPGPCRVSAFKEELLLQLMRRHNVLQKQLQHQPQQLQLVPQQQILLLYRLLYGAAKLKMKFDDAPKLFQPIVDKGTPFPRV